MDYAINIVKEGDYLEYLPSCSSYVVDKEASGCSSEQVYSPVKETKWQVFKKESGVVEIISKYGIGELTLDGILGYTRLVGTLNALCAAYVNPEYAVKGRSVGCTEKSINELPAPLPLDASKEEPYDEREYLADKEQLTKINWRPCNYIGVWFASRGVYIVGSHGFFGAHILFWYEWPEPVLVELLTYKNRKNRWERYGVCPIIALKPEVKVTGGDGTSANPWKITI